MKLVIKDAYKNAGKCITKQYGLIFFFFLPIQLVIRPFQLSVSHVVSLNSST